MVVYDALGLEVAELVNEMNNSGTHSATFNTAALSSGTYVAKTTEWNERTMEKDDAGEKQESRTKSPHD